MAKHGRASFKRYMKGNVDENMALGTLAAAALISNLWDEAVDTATRVSSAHLSYSLDQLTSPQGPILFGLAHSDYTDAEIEEVIENTSSWTEGDLIGQEVGRRKIRIVGQFVSEELAGVVDVRFNEGKPVKTKLNWILQEGQTLRMWSYNKSSTPLSGTDPTMRANGHVNLWGI